jgi:hypothetical protein
MNAVAKDDGGMARNLSPIAGKLVVRESELAKPKEREKKRSETSIETRGHHDGMKPKQNEPAHGQCPVGIAPSFIWLAEQTFCGSLGEFDGQVENVERL